MRELYSQSTTYIRSFPQVEQRYRDVVDRLNKAVGGKHPGKDLSDADRREILVAISSAKSSLETQYQQVQSARSTFDQKESDLMAKAGELEKSCNAATQSGNPAPGCPEFLN